MIQERASDLAVVASFQVGKSVALAAWKLLRRWTMPGSKGGCFAPTEKQLVIVFDQLSTFARTAGVLVSQSTSPGQRKIVIGAGGREAVEHFYSWDNPETMRGPALDDIGADECGLMTEPAYGIMSSRVAATLGPSRWIGNPGLLSGPFRRLIDRGLDPQRDPALFATYRWTWRELANVRPCICGLGPVAPDAPPSWFQHSEPECKRRAYLIRIATQKDTLPPEMFATAYEAEFASGEGSVFRQDCIRDKTTGEPAVTPEAGHRYVIGVDVAQEVDYLVAAVWDADGGPRLCALDRWRGLPYHASEARLAGLSQHWHGATLVIETNGPGRPLYDALNHRGVGVREFVTTAQSKGPAILAFAAALHDPESGVTLAPIPPLQDELRSFRFERTLNGYRYTAPSGMHDDCVMAAAVGHQALTNPHAGMLDYLRSLSEEKAAAAAKAQEKQPGAPFDDQVRERRGWLNA